jgi:hypothetical protein
MNLPCATAAVPYNTMRHARAAREPQLQSPRRQQQLRVMCTETTRTSRRVPRPALTASPAQLPGPGTRAWFSSQLSRSLGHTLATPPPALYITKCFVRMTSPLHEAVTVDPSWRPPNEFLTNDEAAERLSSGGVLAALPQSSFPLSWSAGPEADGDRRISGVAHGAQLHRAFFAIKWRPTRDGHPLPRYRPGRAAFSPSLLSQPEPVMPRAGGCGLTGLRFW